MAELSDRVQRDVGKPPFSVNICLGERVAVTTVPDRATLIALFQKLAARLPIPGERGLMLIWLSDLPDPLPHFGCCSAEGWRVSFSGEIGVSL